MNGGAGSKGQMAYSCFCFLCFYVSRRRACSSKVNFLEGSLHVVEPNLMKGLVFCNVVLPLNSHDGVELCTVILSFLPFENIMFVYSSYENK